MRDNDKKVVSVEQMRQMDAYTIEHFIPGRSSSL